MSIDRRDTDRCNVDLAVNCRVPATSCKAIMRNLSNGGCRLDLDKTLQRGTTVLIDLGERRETAGTVVWAVGKAAGVRFLMPLSDEIAARIGGTGGLDVEVKAA